jgi:N-acetylglucosamine transport system substrate-binding protein
MSNSREPGLSLEPKADLDRRTLLRRAAAVGLLVTPIGGVLGACSDKKNTGSNTGDGQKTDTNPFGVKSDAPLDVVIFKGGYSDKYATDVHEPLYQKAFPKAKINHQGIVEIGKTLQPRFAGGTPPDMVNNSGSGAMDFGALVADKQLADLTPLWDAPSVDDTSKKVRDTVVNGTIEVGAFNGTPYVLYYVSTVFGLWYSAKLFKEKGWTPPTTWDDFVKLCDDIKKAGITPYGYAGANAAYYQYNVILTSAAKIGGAEVLKNIDNLEDGAWTAEPVKKAADAWAQIGGSRSNKAFEGLKHTDVQLQQNQYKVAFYPSGDWLPNEQTKDAPADFEYKMIPNPGMSGDKMSAAAVRATAGEGYVVPEKAKNKAGGMEYLRQMLSKAGGKGFSGIVKSPTVVLGSSDGIDFGSGVSSSQAALKAAGKDVVNFFFDGDYKPLDQECRAATNELMFGRSTAEQFCTRMQKKADEVKKDSSITKFKR